MSVSVLIAEDHALFRSGLVALLKGDTKYVVAGLAANGREAVEMAETLRPAIVLMDLGMPELNGLDAMREITAKRDGPKVLALSSFATETWVIRAMSAGARGYVLKTESPEGLKAAIDAVSRGGTWFSAAVADMLARLLIEPRFMQTEPLYRISPRQRQVLQLIAEGYSNREIASKLKLSESTVDTHRTELMRRLGVHEVAALVRFACREGLVS